MSIRECARSALDRIMAHFEVPSSSGMTLPQLDGLRGIAVMMVLSAHAWGAAGLPSVSIPMPLTPWHIGVTSILASGAWGVALFFVLSGFLLSQGWFRADYMGESRPDLRRYLRLRLFRIVPAYYCCLLFTATLLTGFIIRSELVYSGKGLVIFGIHAAFLPSFLESNLVPYNGAWWTLTLEMMFYLILPWLVVLFLRNRWMVTLPALIVISYCWVQLTSSPHMPGVQWFLHLYRGWFPASTYGGDDISEAMIRGMLLRQLPFSLWQFGVGIAIANLYVRYQLGELSHRAIRLFTSRAAGNCYFMVGCVILALNVRNMAAHTFPTGDGWPLSRPLRIMVPQMPMPVGFGMVLMGLLWGNVGIKRAFSLVQGQTRLCVRM